MHLISVRCNRLIIIVSKAFLRSPENNFFVNYTQALGIEQGKNKIIPCLYEHCDLPQTLKIYFILNYLRSGSLYNFWDKLRETLETAKFQTDRIANRPRQLALKGPLNQNQNQQYSVKTMSDSERTKRRNEELKMMKKRDREMIDDLNNSVQLHLTTTPSPSSESCRIEEILPSPPITPPVSPPPTTKTSKMKSSISMLDLMFLKSSSKKHKEFTKSQSNLNQSTIYSGSTVDFEDSSSIGETYRQRQPSMDDSLDYSPSKKHSSSSHSLKHSKLFKWLHKKESNKGVVGSDNITVTKVEKPKKKKKKNIFGQMLKEKE